MAIGVTVIEYQQFKQKASRFLSEEEVRVLVDCLSDNPKSGVEFPGTGGIRHLKWPNHEVKSGEKCIVGYYFSSAKMPLHLLNVFKVGEKDLLAKIIGVVFECR
jgi:hypothetical protein